MHIHRKFDIWEPHARRTGVHRAFLSRVRDTRPNRVDGLPSGNTPREVSEHGDVACDEHEISSLPRRIAEVLWTTNRPLHNSTSVAGGIVNDVKQHAVVQPYKLVQ